MIQEEGVGLGLEVLDRVDVLVAQLGAEFEEILAPFAEQLVLAGVAVEDVLTAVALDDVLVLSGEDVLDLLELVLADLRAMRLSLLQVDDNLVGRAGVDDKVGTSAAVIFVIASTTATDDRVLTGPSFDVVVTVTAVQHVVAGEPAEIVVPTIAVNVVLGCGSRKLVVEVRARNNDHRPKFGSVVGG